MADLKCYAGKCAHGLTVICLSTLAGILAPLIFLLVMIIVESIQPGYNPIQDLISELALGLYGWFQTLSFFLIGLLFSVFTLRLYMAMLKRITTVVGTTFFSLSSLGFSLLGAFPMDPGGVGLAMPGLVHSVAATEVVSSFILGCFAFAVYFRTDSQWNKFWLYTILTALRASCFFSMGSNPVRLAMERSQPAAYVSNRLSVGRNCVGQVANVLYQKRAGMNER